MRANFTQITKTLRTLNYYILMLIFMYNIKTKRETYQTQTGDIGK